MPLLRIIVLLTIFLSESYAQKSDYYFHLNAAKGLPAAIIYNLHIDREGRLLLASEKGLYRYNGIYFTRLICPTAINKEITDIVSNREGRILAHNFSGQLFELIRDSLVEVHLPQQPKEIQNIKLYDKILYLFSPKKTYQYSLPDYRLLDSFSIKDRKTDIVDAILGDDGEEIINLIDSTILYRKHGKIMLIRTSRSKNVILHKGQVYLTPYNGSLPLQTIAQGNTKTIRALPFRNNPITINTNVISDKFYISSQNGLCVYDPVSGTSSVLFEGEKTTDAKKDMEGNLWVSTLGNGIFMLPNNGLTKYSSNPYTSICEGPDSTFFCGTSKGIVQQFDARGKSLRILEPMNNLIESSFIWYDAETHRLYTNTSVFTIGKGLISSDSKNIVDYCKNITKDEAGNYWLAKPYALIFVKHNANLEKRGLVYELGRTTASEEWQIRNVRTRCVHCFAPNQIYAAFVDGLYEADKSLNIREVKDKSGKSYNPRFITSDSRHVYLGTLDKGVYVLDHNQEIRHYTMRDGLSSNTIQKLVLLKNKLFVFTDEGLDQIDLQTQKVSGLNSVFGLNSISIRDINIVYGRLFIASDDGVIEVNNMSRKAHVPNVLIKGIYSNKQPISRGLLANIPYEKRNISIKFEPVTYSATSNFVIQYRLQSDEIRQPDWSELNSLTEELNFPNLPSGNYSFSIRVYQPQFGSYSKTASIVFNIKRPWYTSGWLITVLLLSALILLVSALAIRSRLAEKKQLEELQRETLRKELAESKLTALKARMNPHFVYNVLNSIQSLIYTSKINEANHYMVKYADLTRRYLEQSAKDQISLREEVETLSDYLDLEKLRFEESFSYTITCDPLLDIGNTFIPPLLLQPFIENSVKHGLLHQDGDKKLSVLFQAKGHDLLIRIEDNGIGLARSAEINARRQNKPASFATSAIFQKINLLNRYRQNPISFKLSETGHGTLVVLILPDTL